MGEQVETHLFANYELLSQTKLVGFSLLLDVNMLMNPIINFPCEGQMIQSLQLQYFGIHIAVM